MEQDFKKDIVPYLRSAIEHPTGMTYMPASPLRDWAIEQKLLKPQGYGVMEITPAGCRALRALRRQIASLTKERDKATENYNRAWNQRDAQRRRAEAAESRLAEALSQLEKLEGDRA